MGSALTTRPSFQSPTLFLIYVQLCGKECSIGPKTGGHKHGEGDFSGREWRRQKSICGVKLKGCKCGE